MLRLDVGARWIGGKRRKEAAKGVTCEPKNSRLYWRKKGGTERLERKQGGIDHATVRLRLAVVARASLERQPEA